MSDMRKYEKYAEKVKMFNGLSAEEVSHSVGLDADGVVRRVRLAPEGTRVSNPGFDVTPARLVSALITERGVIDASEQALSRLRDELLASG